MKRMILALAAAAVTAGASAQVYDVLPTDARTLGMGGISTAVTAGAQSVWHNPAATLFGRVQAEAGASLRSMRGKMHYGAAGFVRLTARHSLSAGWRGYDFGPAEKDRAVSLGYARRVGEVVGIGATLDYSRFVRERTGNALSAGVAAFCELPLGVDDRYGALRLGLKLSGLGGFWNGTDAMKLPVRCTFGAAYALFVADSHEVTLAAEGDYAFSPVGARGIQGAVGAEYALAQILRFRAGYHAGESRLPYTDYGTVGLGVRFMHICFDFGYVLAAKESPLRNSYSIGIGLDF